MSDELLPLGEELLLEPLGEALLPDALPLVDESLEPDELGEDELPDVLGVAEDELEELGVLDGLVDEPDALDELGELELGVLADPLLLEESLLEPDIEPDGEDGEVLLELEPVAEPERDAPGPPALSQP